MSPFLALSNYCSNVAEQVQIAEAQSPIPTFGSSCDLTDGRACVPNPIIAAYNVEKRRFLVLFANDYRHSFLA